MDTTTPSATATAYLDTVRRLAAQPEEMEEVARLATNLNTHRSQLTDIETQVAATSARRADLSAEMEAAIRGFDTTAAQKVVRAMREVDDELEALGRLQAHLVGTVIPAAEAELVQAKKRAAAAVRAAIRPEHERLRGANMQAIGDAIDLADQVNRGLRTIWRELALGNEHLLPPMIPQRLAHDHHELRMLAREIRQQGEENFEDDSSD